MSSHRQKRSEGMRGTFCKKMRKALPTHIVQHGAWLVHLPWTPSFARVVLSVQMPQQCSRFDELID